MSVRMRLEGMDELIKELQRAPEEIRAEAKERVRFVTEGAATELRQRFARHVFTGTLLGSVRVIYPEDYALVGVVRSVAPHGHLFMWGTKRRKVRGRNRGRFKDANRGRMPRMTAPNIVDIARRWRNVMVRDLSALLTARGFQVTE